MKTHPFRSAIAIGAALAALAIGTQANAATFLFKYDVDATRASGLFVTADTSATAGYLLVTSLTGTYGTDAMSLLPKGVFPTDVASDNLLSPTGVHVTENGISFTAGGKNYNLWYDGTTRSYQQCSDDGSGLCSTADVTGLSITAAPSAVPEPGTWVMLTLGVGLIGAVLRRRRPSAIAVA